MTYQFFTSKPLLFLTVLCLGILVVGCTGTPEVLTEDDVPKFTDADSSFSLMADIGARMTRSEGAEYSVTYDSEYQGEVSKLMMYSDGKSFRFDTISSGGETRSFTLEGSQYMCARDAGQFICLKSVDTGAKQEALPEIEMLRTEEEVAAEEEAAADASIKAYRDGTIEVTGHVGDCFGFERPGVRERLCLSKEGIILFHESTDSEGTTTMHATSYSTRVDADVFELPAGATIADLDAPYAGMGDTYAREIAEAESAGSCFDACESQGLTGDALTACYQTCA